jgi:hypothetical protein
MFRLLVALIVYWALTSSGTTPDDLRQIAEWASDHLRVSVR